jgi:hypothetical protein
MMNSGLAMVQTTNNVFNNDLFDKVCLILGDGGGGGGVGGVTNGLPRMPFFNTNQIRLRSGSDCMQLQGLIV